MKLPLKNCVTETRVFKKYNYVVNIFQILQLRRTFFVRVFLLFEW
ncbi:hypothetical protein E2C01_076761 [Portunus trituberculatus]|uniref:Uncharacterized protein n=1 Tax=Portunus trituberculatus TaxID=210409 RepID=A0A5B7IJU9_PORTR|nr:hypothetical protein [Portunus trituberculatus]